MASFEHVIALFFAAHLYPIISVSAAIDSCYTANINPYRYYSEATSYKDVAPKDPLNLKTVCQPTFLYLLNRHGTRYPSEDDIISFNSMIPPIRDALSEETATLCQADIDKIKQWRSMFHPSNENDLTDFGKAELFGIGQRLQNKFPELLKAPFDENAATIRHTYKGRTRDSALAFASAVYKTQDVPMEFAPKGADYLLRFHKPCTVFRNTIDKTPIVEYEQFIRGPVMSDVIANVTQRLGLEPGRLTYDEVEMLWNACRYEHSILGESPWCAAFVKSELQVLEFSRDVLEYWERGPGAPINAEMTCLLVKDIVEKLRSAESGSELKAALRFGHQGTMQRLFTKLGLFQDDSPLLADNMEPMASRNFRVSRRIPFAANIVFILYTCGDGPYLRVLVNEAPIQMPGCDNTDMCPMSTVLGDSGLQDFADNCDYNEICGNNPVDKILDKTSSQQSMMISWLLIGLSIFITGLF